MNKVKKHFRNLGTVVMATFGLLVTSCETDGDDEVVVVVISEERAAEIVAASLAYNTYGLASNVNYFSNGISDELNCGEQGSNSGTLNYSSIFGNVASTYQFDEDFSKSCEPAEAIAYSIDAFQDIDAVYFDSRQDVESKFTVTGLETGATNELYSGSYQREGDWFSKIYLDSLDLLYMMNFTDLSVDKDTYFIVSGTSTFSLEVDYSETMDRSTFSGTVTFINEDEARIDFENGDSYLLDLETGEINLIQS